jgi:ABC-type taurine transport system substrate-binding protein
MTTVIDEKFSLTAYGMPDEMVSREVFELIRKQGEFMERAAELLRDLPDQTLDSYRSWFAKRDQWLKEKDAKLVK